MNPFTMLAIAYRFVFSRATLDAFRCFTMKNLKHNKGLILKELIDNIKLP